MSITYFSMYILFIWYGSFWHPLRPLAASEATRASKQPQRSNLTSDLKSSDPNYLLIMCILFIWYGPSWQPLEATTASKQPRRSKLSPQLKLVTPIYYKTKFQGISISQKMTLFPGGDKHDPLTRSAIAPLVISNILQITTPQ